MVAVEARAVVSFCPHLNALSRQTKSPTSDRLRALVGDAERAERTKSQLYASRKAWDRIHHESVPSALMVSKAVHEDHLMFV